MGYSLERKSAVLKRMLPPNTIAIRQLSQEEGISEATLYDWRATARRKGQLLPDADAGPEGWSSRDKFAAVLETAALNEADLAEHCRKRGIFPEQIKAWRMACEQANDWERSSTFPDRSGDERGQEAGQDPGAGASPQGPRIGRNRSATGSAKKGCSDLGGGDARRMISTLDAAP